MLLPAISDLVRYNIRRVYNYLHLKSVNPRLSFYLLSQRIQPFLDFVQFRNIKGCWNEMKPTCPYSH